MNVVLILGLLILDAITKLIAPEYFREAWVIIPGLLNFQYFENTGIAFSIPITGVFLKVLTVVLIFGIFWYYWKEERPKHSRLLNLSFAMIFAGALGNAWERIFRGYVTDFIALEYFAVFNLADSYISIGAVGVLWYYYKNN